MEKFAVTDVFAFNTTVHVAVPVQAPPPQPVKTLPEAADAVSVAVAPVRKLALQVVPQLI